MIDCACWLLSSSLLLTLPLSVKLSSGLTQSTLLGPPHKLTLESVEEMYPCTRMYSVHKPIKKCIGSLCLYSLPRVYVINNEICMRTVCQDDEYLKAELCRELSGWPRRIQRSSNRKRCHKRHGNAQTWANKA
uniref:Microfibril associated protein 5 n=1 Tax=Amphilophus citrinellus TaxID=61819 RepID=A0A3Q0S1E1_AMPCI